jgi:hypothetical protein
MVYRAITGKNGPVNSQLSAAVPTISREQFMPPFEKGISGNPRGRPPGVTSAKLRDSIAKSAPALVAVLMERALAGDSLAASCLLERALGPIKAKE